ncbi:MAG TPA: HdeD family acid-resistance protein [Rubrobacter sp.]|nr:HdeD family acid-resistance protein [Rubrobacter sp.]
MSYTQPQPILPMMAGNWWALLIRGIAAVTFGVAAFLWPGPTLYVLIIFFGAYALVDGLFAIAAGIRGTAGRRRWLLLAEGILGVVAGLVAFFYPGMTALVLLYVIAFWAIFTGILKIAMAISLRREIENEWLMGLGGVLSVLFGIILAVLPGVGLLSLVWLISIYAIVFGVAQIALGFRVRSHRRDTPSREQGQAS